MPGYCLSRRGTETMTPTDWTSAVRRAIGFEGAPPTPWTWDMGESDDMPCLEDGVGRQIWLWGDCIGLDGFDNVRVGVRVIRYVTRVQHRADCELRRDLRP